MRRKELGLFLGATSVRGANFWGKRAAKIGALQMGITHFH